MTAATPDALSLGAQTEASTLAREIDAALPIALAVRVTDPATYESASNMLREFVTRRAQIEKMRTRWTQPLNEILRVINGGYKPVDTKYDQAEKHLRKEMGEHTLRVERTRVEAMKLATQGAPAPIDPVPQHAEVQGTSTRIERRWRVVNAHAIPRDLCSPDEAKIKGAIALHGQNAPIPGIEWYDHSVVVARKVVR